MESVNDTSRHPVPRKMAEVVDMERKKRKLLCRMFDRQVDTLLKKRYPLAAHMSESRFIGECIDPLRKRVEEVDAVMVGDGLLPLLVVIRFRTIRPHELMSRVVFDGHEGFTFLAGEAFLNVVRIPDAPSYLALGVENGSALRNIGQEKGAEELRRMRRYGLTVEEGVALVTHCPEIFRDHCVDLHGSFQGSYMPSICICETDGRKGCPQLNIWEPNNGSAEIGIASCAERIG